MGDGVKGYDNSLVECKLAHITIRLDKGTASNIAISRYVVSCAVHCQKPLFITQDCRPFVLDTVSCSARGSEKLCSD